MNFQFASQRAAVRRLWAGDGGDMCEFAHKRVDEFSDVNLGIGDMIFMNNEFASRPKFI